MPKKVYDTIIIGAGIAGLSCARKLFDKDHKNFKIISEDIGGRIYFSKDNKVPYGAYFIGDDYKHMLKYTQKGRKIDLFEIAFHKKKKTYFILKCLQYPIQFIKLILILKKYIKSYNKFKKNCTKISQKEAIERDPFLNYLFKTPANEFLREYRINKIAKNYLTKVIYGLVFCPATELKALEYVRWAQYLLSPIYDFTFRKNKLLKGIKGKIEKNTITEVQKTKETYTVKTKDSKKYKCKNLVVAIPLENAKKLLKLKTKVNTIKAYMFHIKGKIRQNWKQKEYDVFGDQSEVLDLAHQSDGTYLFYHQKKNPNFSVYFTEHSIIAQKYWNPAFSFAKGDPLEFNRGENLYIIGDFNTCGMEDTFITGIYAANQILKNN